MGARPPDGRRERWAAAQEEDASLLEEVVALAGCLSEQLDQWETRRLLSGPFDEKGAVLQITAGAGGQDAMDWACMLERMYLRWAQKQVRAGAGAHQPCRLDAGAPPQRRHATPPTSR